MVISKLVSDPSRRQWRYWKPWWISFSDISVRLKPRPWRSWVFVWPEVPRDSIAKAIEMLTGEMKMFLSGAKATRC
jgi:hypothetical protein